MALIGAATVGAGAAPTSSAHDRLLREIGQFTQARDAHRLRSLATDVGALHDRTVANVYNAAVYYASPRGDAATFIARFPEDFRGVMYDLGYVFPATTHLGRSTAFDALEKLAAAGNEHATRKLLLIFAASDGSVAETIASEISDVAAARPEMVLRVMQMLPRSNVDRLINDPLPWCDSMAKIRAVKPASPQLRALQNRIRASAARCR